MLQRKVKVARMNKSQRNNNSTEVPKRNVGTLDDSNKTLIQDFDDITPPRKSKYFKELDEKDVRKQMNYKLQKVVSLILDNLDGQNILAYQTCMEHFYPKENNMSKSKKDALYVLRFCAWFVNIFFEYN